VIQKVYHFLKRIVKINNALFDPLKFF
jgi:hypothetical protein